ncbi:MAG TPA: cytochrome c biogenesis protein ResB [Anaeromyxobacter sp.]|nr:cytochrome c biogenesis protein ResB [Anaeromyxobacter sp.]
MNAYTKKLWDAVTSLSLTIACLALLMVLVVACTLAQVRLGTFGAVSVYMRSWFYWMDLGSFRIPIYPAGATVGLVLMVNLVAAQLKRLELSWRKSGIWIVHAGLILLFVGEFVTGAFQVDGRLAVEEGQTVDFVEVPRHMELAVVDTTDAGADDVFGIPETTLARGGLVPVRSPGKTTPLAVRVKRYARNVLFSNAGPGMPSAGADQGVGKGVAMQEIPPVTTDDRVDMTAAVVEILADGKSLGTWLASNAIDQPQPFSFGGRRYELSLRFQRTYLPYSLTLEKFRHDVYPGTDIPKNFSSLVRLRNPATGEDRNVLIYMNQPLRYDGKAFYQASFGKNDTLSILQVVSNPGWLLPYVSTVLVTLGLLVHFARSLRRGIRRAGAAGAAASAARAA